MTDLNTQKIEYDMAEIEARARQMRAEAIAETFAALRAWISSFTLFSGVRQAT